MTTIFDRIRGVAGNQDLVDAVTPPAAEKQEEKRIKGKIIKVKEDAGWGFISSKDIKFTRIFFHWTSLRQDTLKFTELRNGMEVEFTPTEIPEKGWRAIKINVLTKDDEKTSAS